MVIQHQLPVTATGYPITVGAGGAGAVVHASPAPNRTNGSNSVFSTITSTGGGGGGGKSGADEEYQVVQVVADSGENSSGRWRLQ